MKATLKTLAACAALAVAGLANAQDIKIANIVELSGPGTTAGTVFKNGVELAIKEINAAGGILGKKIESVSNDTQSNPGVAKGLTQKAVDNEVFAIFGPVFSGSIMVSMAESRRAEVPNWTGGEAASITEQGNPYVFRTSFTQETAMPKVAKYIVTKSKNLAVIYVNNDFGKGGLDMIKKALAGTGTNIVAEISTDAGQVDFSPAVLKAKSSNADAVFVYSNEEESARALRELRKQGWDKPIIGDVTLLGQKVIDLAGEAANGVVGHSEMSADAPIPAIQAVRDKFVKDYKFVPDHNGIKGYQGVYMLKAGIEKVGKFDRPAVAKALHGMTIKASEQPGILMDVTFDDKGDIDRDSFLIEIQGGKPVVKEILPPLGKK